MTDAAIHRGSRGRVRGCLFVCWFTVDRRGLRPRDDKVRGNAVSGSVTTRSLSLRGKSEARDAAIHRISEDASRFCLFACWFTVDRHGLRPRDDKVW